MVENPFWKADDKHSCTATGCEQCNLKRIEANSKLVMQKVVTQSFYDQMFKELTKREELEKHLTRVQAHNTELTLQVRDLKAEVERLSVLLDRAYGGGL